MTSVKSADFMIPKGFKFKHTKRRSETQSDVHSKRFASMDSSLVRTNSHLLTNMTINMTENNVVSSNIYEQNSNYQQNNLFQNFNSVTEGAIPQITTQSGSQDSNPSLPLGPPPPPPGQPTLDSGLQLPELKRPTDNILRVEVVNKDAILTTQSTPSIAQQLATNLTSFLSDKTQGEKLSEEQIELLNVIKDSIQKVDNSHADRSMELEQLKLIVTRLDSLNNLISDIENRKETKERLSNVVPTENVLSSALPEIATTPKETLIPDTAVTESPAVALPEEMEIEIEKPEVRDDPVEETTVQPDSLRVKPIWERVKNVRPSHMRRVGPVALTDLGMKVFPGEDNVYTTNIYDEL